jgi:hypothetical protein
MLARLKVKKGDTLYAIETKEGYLITPYDPGIADQLDAGREFMTGTRVFSTPLWRVRGTLTPTMRTAPSRILR